MQTAAVRMKMRENQRSQISKSSIPWDRRFLVSDTWAVSPKLHITSHTLFSQLQSEVYSNLVSIFLPLQGRLLNLSCSTVPTFVLSITATTQVKQRINFCLIYIVAHD